MNMAWRGVTVGLLVFCALNLRAADFYVAAGGSNTDPYGSWGTAAHSIHDSVAAAVAAGTDHHTVYVTNGTYYLTNDIRITTSMTLRSWRDGALDRDGTILNGNYPNRYGRCLSLGQWTGSGGSTNILVEGFTITNGFLLNNNGGGVYLYHGTVRNCLITGNVISNNNTTLYYGGGVFAEIPDGSGGSAISKIINCDIIGNTASGVSGYGGSGGGLHLSYRTEVRDSRILRNRAPVIGGIAAGVYVRSNAGSDAHPGAALINCVIDQNTSEADGEGPGGIYITGGYNRPPTVLRGCQITRNHANWDEPFRAAIYLSQTKVVIDSCTIAGNAAWNAAAIRNHNNNGSYIYCTNSIIYSHPFTFEANPWTTRAVNSCLEHTAEIDQSVNNITDDPMFVDPGTGGDYRLQEDSPCIDEGTNLSWMVDATDLLGTARIHSGTVDMGCYEFDPPPRGTMILIQ